MIIVLHQDATADQISKVQERLERHKLQSRLIEGDERKVLAVIGNVTSDSREVALMPGVAEVVRVGRPYKLASREAQSASSVMVGNVQVGGPQIVVMAGPCSVESREGFFQAAEAVLEGGAQILRGGAYKPRTSPYAFQGMAEEGLKILAEARERYGMPVVTEVVSPSHVELVSSYVDLLQIGARNMQNFELLKAVSQSNKPVLLKRGLSATIEEFLMSAEYVLAGGNKVILCERGIRTFETSTRNTLDLSAVPVIRSLSHLPILVDPSHGTGHRPFVHSMALAGVAAGADALMIEVHPNPPEALSDGPQSLYPEQFARTMRDIAAIAPVVGRHLPFAGRRRQFAVSAPQGQLKVAYQGEPGAFSEAAAGHFFGSGTEASPTSTFAETFARAARGEVHHAIVPVENSLGGSIHQNYDLLLEHPELVINGEVLLRIRHNLIANPGVNLADVKRVYAHPQAAAQCDDFLRSQPDWEVINLNDTAGSVRYVKDHNLRDAAAIASAQAAKNLDMQVLKEGIETHPRNFTRFVILTQSSQAQPDPKADKASIVFATGHAPGALFAALSILAEHKINMLKLESRPIPGKPWEYMFYADVQIPEDAADFQAALGKLQEICPFYRHLGSYRAALPLEAPPSATP